ncbi:hypothetical protein GCM10027168_69890 [Streptomyces capparidis]
MRTRKILVGLFLGTIAGLGLVAAPAQAAPAAPPASSASAEGRTVSQLASAAPTPTTAAGWTYVDWYLTQTSCRAHGAPLGLEWENWYCGKSGALWYLYMWTSGGR